MHGALGTQSAGEKLAKGVVFSHGKLNWTLSHWLPAAVPTGPLLEVTISAAMMVKYGIKPYGLSLNAWVKIWAVHLGTPMGDGFSHHTLTSPPVDIHDPLWTGEKIKMMQWNHEM